MPRQHKDRDCKSNVRTHAELKLLLLWSQEHHSRSGQSSSWKDKPAVDSAKEWYLRQKTRAALVSLDIESLPHLPHHQEESSRRKRGREPDPDEAVDHDDDDEPDHDDVNLSPMPVVDVEDQEQEVGTFPWEVDDEAGLDGDENMNDEPLQSTEETHATPSPAKPKPEAKKRPAPKEPSVPPPGKAKVDLKTRADSIAADPKADPKAKVEPKAKADPKAKVEPKAKADPKAKVEPKARADPKAKVKAAATPPWRMPEEDDESEHEDYW